MYFNSVLVLSILTPAALGVTNAPRFADRFTFNAPYSQDFSDGYSILKHVGSLGPYANHASSGVGRDPPDGCKVDQVIMLRRHGERYPQSSELASFNSTLEKLKSSGISQWRDDLYFVNKWHWEVPDAIYALETASGPYNGLLTTFKHGAEYRARYNHLFDPHSKKKVPVFTAKYERIVQTARKFSEGFFGWNYTTSAALNFIPEGYGQGANTLTPKCAPNDGYGKVCESIKNERPIYKVAAERLNKQNPGLQLNETDIYHLMSYSIYELNYQGYSEWTNVFTLDEWVEFGYNEDLGFYYCVGPGNKYSLSRGSVFANASLTLLNQGPEKNGALFFNFAHDSNITPVLYALGIHVPEKDLPFDKVAFPNPYKIGDIMPMGGHLVLERLQCDATANSKAGIYVRAILNEAVMPYNDCQDGPGFSCSLPNWTKMVHKRLKHVDYIKDCKVNSTVPQYVDFFWNYNTSSALNHQTEEYIPYQGLEAV